MTVFQDTHIWSTDYDIYLLLNEGFSEILFIDKHSYSPIRAIGFFFTQMFVMNFEFVCLFVCLLFFFCFFFLLFFFF